MSAAPAVVDVEQPAGNVVSLDEWRARRRPHDLPDPDPAGGRPDLRLVEPGEAVPQFRLDVFLSRARLVLAEG